MKRAFRLWSKMAHEWGRDWDQTQYRALYVRKLSHLFRQFKTDIEIQLDLSSKPQFFPAAPKQVKAINYTKNGVSIDAWLRENLKGKCFIVANGENMSSSDFYFDNWKNTLTMRLRFTDPREATYFKMLFA